MEMIKHVPPLTESHLIEGFYEIEDFSRYLINEDGLIYDLKRDVVINEYIDRSNYRIVSMVRDSTGKRSILRHHRMVAIAFLDPRPDNYHELVVNHLDCDTLNNHPLNLEWTTYKGNAEHAILNNLIPSREGISTSRVPVEAKDVLTGDIYTFGSVAAASVFLDANAISLKRKIDTQYQPLYLCRYLVRRLYSDNGPWREVEEEELAYNNDRHSVQIRNAATGEVHEFISISKAASFARITKDAVMWRCNDAREAVWPDGFQYRYKSTKPWRVLSDNLQAELDATGTNKPILLRNLNTGEVITFSKQRDLAKHLGAVEGAITQWLAAPNQPIRYNGHQVKKLHDPSPWIDHPNWEILAKKTQKTQKFVRRTLPSGEVINYDSINDASRKSGIGLSSISFKVKRGKVDKKGELWELVG